MTEREREYRAIYEETFRVAALLDEGARFRDGYRKVGPIGHGWFMRVARGTRAVLLLDENGYNGEAPPLRRSVIEHSVGLEWLAAEGDNVLEALKVGHQEWVSNLRRSLADSPLRDDEHFDNVAASVEGAKLETKVLNKFVTRANRYSAPQTLQGYFAETGLSHATYESASAYFDLDQETPLANSKKLEPQQPFCAVYLVGSLTSYFHLFEEEDLRDALKPVQERLRRLTIADRSERGWTIPPELADPAV